MNKKREEVWKNQALLMSFAVSTIALLLLVIGIKFFFGFVQKEISDFSAYQNKVSQKKKSSKSSSSSRGVKEQSRSTKKYNWKFPKSACGDRNPPGEQNFYPVYVNKVDSKTLNYIKRNYCKDAYLLVRKDSSKKSVQVASFAIKDKAFEFAQIMINDPNIDSGEVGNPSLR
jgi:hypothetical protein